ncbi:MAG: hypothetical protein ACE5DI_00220 [Candidatus Micrarchaeia archaeon]
MRKTGSEKSEKYQAYFLDPYNNPKHQEIIYRDLEFPIGWFTEDHQLGNGRIIAISRTKNGERKLLGAIQFVPLKRNERIRLRRVPYALLRIFSARANVGFYKKHNRSVGDELLAIMQKNVKSPLVYVTSGLSPQGEKLLRRNSKQFKKEPIYDPNLGHAPLGSLTRHTYSGLLKNKKPKLRISRMKPLSS